MQNRVFGKGNGDGDGRPKREVSPSDVAETLAAVRRGDPLVCRHFAQQVVRILDSGRGITPLKKG
jgi:hypothetical protein